MSAVDVESRWMGTTSQKVYANEKSLTKGSLFKSLVELSPFLSHLLALVFEYRLNDSLAIMYNLTPSTDYQPHLFVIFHRLFTLPFRTFQSTN